MFKNKIVQFFYGWVYLHPDSLSLGAACPVRYLHSQLIV